MNNDRTFPELPPAPVTPEILLDWLQANGIDATTHRHAAVFTVDESQALRGTIAGAHTKNLFVKDKKSRYFLLTAKEDSVVDLKTLHQKIGATGRVSFGKPDALEELLGVKPGAVTAFGIVNDRRHAVTFAIDRALLDHAIVNCHPLTNEATTGIAVDDLLAFARHCGHEPLVIDPGPLQ